MSLAFGPLIFWFSLPDSSEAIVDFFREFTVHVDSLGYVCSFAVFDFNRNGNVKVPALPLITIVWRATGNTEGRQQPKRKPSFRGRKDGAILP